MVDIIIFKEKFKSKYKYMEKKYSIKVIRSIINLQIKFRNFIKEKNLIEEKINFVNDILMSLINNLCNLNNLKYLNDNNDYLIILNNLKEIKNKITLLPNPLTLKVIKNYGGINKIIIKIYEITNELINITTIISPENFSYLFKLLLGDKWLEKFNINDIEEILFYSRMFVSINVYDTLFHKNIPQYTNENDINSTKKDNEALKIVGNNIIEIIINGSKDNVSKDDSNTEIKSIKD